MITMLVAYHRESVHSRDLAFESLRYFAKWKDEAYQTRLRHLATNFISHQGGGSLTHAGSNLPIYQQQHGVTRTPTSNVNLIDNGEGVEEEDVLEVKGVVKHTTEKNLTTEPVQQLNEQHQLFYTDT